MLKQICDELKTNIDSLKAKGFNLETIYFTYESIAPDNAIKVSRKIFHKLLADKQVVLHNYNELSNLLAKPENETLDNITKVIRNIFAQSLNRNENEIGINQHFFLELGGTSLDYCTCYTRIQDEFNISLELNNKKCVTVTDFVALISKWRREHE
ncbi:MAG: acyl carrier protein [Mycoplasmoidaceae bacterium]|nr:acyl carrier protein [Mycoplasmoidaceae bacterium]